MDDLSTTGLEEQTIMIVPVFTHRTVEIKVDISALNADIEQARAALERVGVNLSESIREVIARIGLDIVSSVFCSSAVRGLPAVERFEPSETLTMPPTVGWSGAFKRLAEHARQQGVMAMEEPPRSAREFLIQKRERARLTQRAQLRDRVKPWEEKGKRFR